jgi:hypothetical protein
MLLLMVSKSSQYRGDEGSKIEEQSKGARFLVRMNGHAELPLIATSLFMGFFRAYQVKLSH